MPPSDFDTVLLLSDTVLLLSDTDLLLSDTDLLLSDTVLLLSDTDLLLFDIDLPLFDTVLPFFDAVLSFFDTALPLFDTNLPPFDTRLLIFVKMPTPPSSQHVGRATSMSTSSPASSSGCREILKFCNSGRLSPIEQLPTEIIEKIYLFVLSDGSTLYEALSFPRSSPLIGFRLASEMIRQELWVEAFWRIHMDADPFSKFFRRRLQERLVKLKWFTKG